MKNEMNIKNDSNITTIDYGINDNMGEDIIAIDNSDKIISDTVYINKNNIEIQISNTNPNNENPINIQINEKK